MLKTLIKKQLREMVSFIYQNKKDGKKKSKAALIFMVIILIYAFGIFGVMFYSMFDQMCNLYFELGIGWLYFTFAGILATGFGVFGSIFTTYTSIYVARDNEFLISMPIDPSKILTARISGCYIMTFFFEMLVVIPCYIVYFVNQNFNALNIIFAIINLFILPLYALSISCILGWVIAIIASKLTKNIKNIITILASVLFLMAYFYLASGSNDVIMKIIQNPNKIAGITQYVFYPFFEFGHGSVGKISSFLISTGIAILIFSIIHVVLSKTFLNLATANKGSNLKKFTKRELGSSSVDRALLKREFIHLKSSPNYILNCSIGTLFMLISAVMLFIKHSSLINVVNMLGTDYAGLICCASFAFMVITNDLTSPSISLEGRSIWIVQSSPIPALKVLKAKIRLHMILTVIPSLILAAVISIVVDISTFSKIMIFVIAVVFPFFQAVFGLMLNLKMPNLKWTNETIAVKQGANIIVSLFGSWTLIIVLAGLYVFINNVISSNVYLTISVAFVAIVSLLIYTWIIKKGTKIFIFL